MKKYFLIGLTVLYGTLLNAQVPQAERDALVALYNSTDGPNWVDHTNWNTTNPVSTWFGVTVANIGGTEHVTQVIIEFNNLTGTIPSEIGNLTEMTFLDFWGNNISGPIPSSFGNCVKLKTFSLEDNALSGNIPASFANLVNMESFWLNGNQFSGALPTFFSNWTNLKYFSIGDINESGNTNNFTGDLDLSNNHNLRGIYVDNTNISNLNLRNGNNTLISSAFYATECPNLTCIFVDDAVYSTTNWTHVDPGATFVETQAQCDALGTEDFSVNSFDLYPNPTKDYFLINSKSSVTKVTLYNIFGKLVKTYPSQTEYSVKGLSHGVYLIKIESEKATTTKKIIVE